eukprot:Skav217058  [mRNA]  locus=scaffold208:143279:149959:+ [translate_table: standard]
MPHSWVAYEPQQEKVALAFRKAALKHNVPLESAPDLVTSPDQLVSWSIACEHAVDQALQVQHRDDPDRFPQPGLPQKARGRCITRRLLTVPWDQPVKTACQGQYNPLTECMSYRTLHWTKQTRRVQSLLALVKKRDRGRNVNHHQLHQEWHAIAEAKGFGSFPKWCARQPELACFPYNLPSVDYLNTLAQLLQFHTEAKIQAETQQKIAKSKFARYYDQQHNHLKATMAAIRGNAHPSLGSTKLHRHASARLHSTEHGLIDLILESQVTFTLGQPATYGPHSCVPVDQVGSKLVAMVDDVETDLPSTAEFHQTITTMQGEKIAADLQRFWSQFWNRDQPNEQHDATAWQDFHDLIAHIPPLLPVWGPAGTLAYNLARIGWKLLPDGTLDTDTVVQLHLLRTPRQAIFDYLEQAWMRHIGQCELQRPEWTQLPTINRRATISCFEHSDPTTHKTTANILTGASMLASQIRHFTDETEHCALCGEPDSYEHRALHCSSTADVRFRHPDLLEEVSHLNPYFVNLPVIYESPYADFQQCYFQHITAASPTTEAQDLIAAASRAQQSLQVYTDGTCDHPSIPTCRRAAFSVIIQLDTTPAQRTEQIFRYKTTGELPSSNRVACVGEVPGQQTIARAELLAITQVAAWRCPVDLWTDATYALGAVALIQSTPHPTLFHNKPNCDLLTELWAHARRPDFRIHKIKAHDLHVDTDTADLTWHKLGNEAADKAAKQFLAHLHRQCPLHLDAQDYRSQYNRCQSWYQYMHDLQVERAKLFQQDAALEPMGHAKATLQDHVNVMLAWEPEHTWSFQYDRQYDDLLGDCIWGSEYTDLLLQWASAIRWPADESAYEPYQLGITWFELATSFCIHSQRGVVVNVGGQHKEFRPFEVPLNSPEVPWAAQIQSFERAINNIQTQLVDRIFPDCRTMAKGIRVLGASHAKHGLAARPAYPHQQLVCEIIQQHMQAVQNDPELESGPIIPEQPAVIASRHFQSDTTDRQRGWHERAIRAARAKRRRGLGMDGEGWGWMVQVGEDWRWTVQIDDGRFRLAMDGKGYASRAARRTDPFFPSPGTTRSGAQRSWERCQHRWPANPGEAQEPQLGAVPPGVATRCPWGPHGFQQDPGRQDLDFNQKLIMTRGELAGGGSVVVNHE